MSTIVDKLECLAFYRVPRTLANSENDVDARGAALVNDY